MNCDECGGSYTSVQSHRALCTRKEVSCVFPDRSSESGIKSITLHRIDGYFKCIHCEKLIKKDENMRVSPSSSLSNALVFIKIRNTL